MSKLPLYPRGFHDFSELDKKELQGAKRLLETPSFIAHITDLVGKPIEAGFEKLPEDWNEGIAEVTRAALLKAAEAAIFTMKDIPGTKASNLWNKALVAATGAGGGFFGLKALALELPISTTIMLRSIAEIAREHGESVGSIETKMACLEVLALGGNVESDVAEESSYYIMRSTLATAVTEATEYLSKGFIQKAVAPEAAPPLIRAITMIAERFSIQITEKTVAQALPVIGAAGGAVINTMFMDHFQDMAKGHFTVRKLERKYGQEKVKKLYDSFPETEPI